MAGIYIHVPVCRSFCIYCDFYSELFTKDSSESFVSALCYEARNRCNEMCGQRINTMYFGGGTPSALAASDLVRIIDELRGCFDLSALEELTIEVNPDDVLSMPFSDLELLLSCGVNRISMGVQSFNDAHLEWMRRRHTARMAQDAVSRLRGAGFGNVSIDLIFGFQGLSRQDWERTLDMAFSLPGGPPEHLSAYQMTLEPGSALSDMYRSGEYEEPDDEISEDQYKLLQHMAQQAGYEQYEVSNFAREGFRSRHNSSYWYHVPYLGLGPGAHSLNVRGGEYVRSWNEPDLASYNALRPERGFEKLSAQEVARERIMLGLRCADGTVLDTDKAAPLVAEGLLEPLGSGRYRIPAQRLFISEYVIRRLV